MNIILNGQKASPSLIKTMMDGLNNKKIRTEKGGYLFKLAVDEKNLYFSILPEFNQGDRNYHYNITLPGNPSYFLTGSLNPEGIFTILFIPKEKVLPEADKEEYINIYLQSARGLLEKGLEEPGELDFVSGLLLVSSGLFDPAPASLKELAAL
ncbi:hypothetical protein [Oceanispirochaeta sp.]|uniref:hypothetical protein n=1 Tax=Oceanispirochaeta sp. TaxID=2035350 RepID=UPI0026151C77|nr:hypothetical protein [Oceanispirochaeta sp.]MDA3958316.1 hypothetical protein [Oceanispirochaeta sp.]